MMEYGIIKLHALGVDERSNNILSFFFQKFCNGRCEISEQQDAELFIINMDSVDADNELSRLTQAYPDSRFILTSIKSIDSGNHYFLRKPMIAKHLLAILDDYRGVSVQEKDQQSVASSNDIKAVKREPTATHTAQVLNKQDVVECVGKTKDINLRKPLERKKIFFDPSHYVLGVLQQAYQRAKQEQRIIRLTGSWRPITIFPDRDEVYVELTDRQLQAICIVSLDKMQDTSDQKDIKIEVLGQAQAEKECADSKKYQNLDAFIWKMALWTSRGRLPMNTPLDKPLYLLGWPNLTRLTVTPYALRIAACWVLHPRSILNIIDVLGIPQRYIFSFFTATYIAGLSGLAIRQSDSLVLPADHKPDPKINFFSRILRTLKTRELK